ncbi:pentapeptide repeat-containing protein [Nocardia heshunensis]
MQSRRGAVVARRRPNRITSLRQPDTTRTRFRRVTHACVSWGGWSRLASITTTIAAVTALWFTSQSLHATNDQYGLARQTATTERYAKAVEELDNQGLDIRLGGIYLLERLASDSPQDRSSIFEILSAFLRTHSPNSGDCGRDHDPGLSADVQAALRVIARRSASGPESIDLRGTCLADADLTQANLQGVNLERANLMNTKLDRANLRGAKLELANLNNASLRETDLTGAVLAKASLVGADLTSAP